MKTAFSTLAKDAAEQCVRMTGKTVAEWEAVWQRRRIRAFRERKLNGQHSYTLRQRDDAIRYYDLAEDDFAASSEYLSPVPLFYRLTQEALGRIYRESKTMVST